MKKQDYEEISRVTVEASSDLKEETFTPLNIERFMILPGRNVYCIAMKGSFTQDMLRKIIELQQKTKTVILSGIFSANNSDPEIKNALIFIDFTNASIKPEEMAAQFGHISSLNHVQIFAPTSIGFVSDNFFFPLKIGNERVIIFRKPLYEAFFSGIREQFGSAGEVFLYYMGIESGSKAFEDYKTISGFTDFKTMADMACAFAFNMGWGVFKLQELNLKKKTIRIRIHDNFECASGKGTGKPYSHFLRGVAAGLFLHFFKTPGTVEETRCIAQGHAFCEFLVKPVKPSAKILHSHI